MAQAAGLSTSMSLALQGLAVDRSTVRVIDVLETGSLPYILLKGPTTASWLYGEAPWARPTVDTDLLVPHERVPEVVGLLTGLGLTPPLAGASVHEQDGHSVVLTAADHNLAEVDVHHTLPGAGLPPAQVWAVLSAHAEPFELLGSTVQALDATGRTVVVLLHAARNGLSDGKSTEDLRRLLAAPVDWEAARRLAQQLEALPAVARALALLPEGAAIASRLDVVGLSSTEMRLRDAAAPALAYGLIDLANTPGLNRKAARLVRELWPTPAFLEVWATREHLPPAGTLGRRRQRLTVLTRQGPGAVAAWWRASRGQSRRS